MNLEPKEYTLEEVAKLIPSVFSYEQTQIKRDKLVDNILNNPNISKSLTLDDDTICNILDVAYRKYFDYAIHHGDTWIYTHGKRYSLLASITCLYDLIYRSKK